MDAVAAKEVDGPPAPLAADVARHWDGGDGRDFPDAVADECAARCEPCQNDAVAAAAGGVVGDDA